MYTQNQIKSQVILISTEMSAFVPVIKNLVSSMLIEMIATEKQAVIQAIDVKGSLLLLILDHLILICTAD